MDEPKVKIEDLKDNSGGWCTEAFSSAEEHKVMWIYHKDFSWIKVRPEDYVEDPDIPGTYYSLALIWWLRNKCIAKIKEELNK